jgi:preprotein translocase subunit SecE
VSDEKQEFEDDPRSSSDADLTDEQIDRQAPGVDDADELQVAEEDVAADAQSEEDKVVAARAAGRQGRRGRITADGEDDEEPAGIRRAARSSAAREGGATRSRAEAERARAESTRQKRSLARFLREVVAELRKVIWPGRRELITYTSVVIVFVAFIVALVAGLDLLFARGVIAVFG